MDGRIIAQPGSGIATYAATLRRAHLQMAPTPLLLKDDSCDRESPPVSGKERAMRWLSALTTSSIQANLETGSKKEAILYAQDIFRLARVRFRQSGKMLNINAPCPHGLIHWSLPVPIRIANWINIYTIHDVIPLSHPHLTPMNSARHRLLLNKILETADHIVTVTTHAEHSIIENLNFSPKLITNCGIPVEPIGFDILALPKPFYRDKYFIFVGSSEPRKNVTALITAYKRSGTSLPLLLIGPHESHADPAAGIWNLPQQPADLLAAFIAQARALVFPSLAEGFGLPVAEAMALGTAVLTSNEGALAEVAGDAALLIDPRDIGTIAQSLAMLANDDALVRSMEQRGRLRTADFSADKFTKKLSELYGALFSRSTMEHA
ncbi:glycosyl transferase group 1 [Sphingobium chlorophenolicum L-1]|uniref:Glycosyl transferase group 1 n=1 Tax=Sphingobium chlorophenolicum L-1 TaxID=690566 RepID=F6F0A6_SPHCR|nr:glycosyltransferase family 1 protein [Sphingobium chlorophenolicum]AEG50330.1 glycosyl transferase group 1 [Sphingobium chlorophenolicum L-1]